MSINEIEKNLNFSRYRIYNRQKRYSLCCSNKKTKYSK